MPETNAYINSISIFTPEKFESNEDLAKIFNKSPTQIFKETGIKQRFLCDKDQLASDLAIEVGKKFFLENNQVKKSDIDVLIYCTSALDYVGPATACLIHQDLGLPKSCLSIDIPSGCAGFSNSLIVAQSMIKSNTAKNILLITADMPTKVIHPNDYQLRALFSDAAAATFISSTGSYEILDSSWGTDGKGSENLIIRGSGARNPVDKNWVNKYDDIGGMLIGKMEMNGMEILKFSLSEVPKLLENVLQKNKINKDGVDHFILHHASGIVLKYLAKKILISDNKMYSCLEDYGNTVSASIPIALYNKEQESSIPTNNLIFIAGFGIGYAWSGTILKKV